MTDSCAIHQRATRSTRIGREFTKKKKGEVKEEEPFCGVGGKEIKFSIELNFFCMPTACVPLVVGRSLVVVDNKGPVE